MSIALLILPLFLPPGFSRESTPSDAGILGTILHKGTMRPIAGAEVRLADYAERAVSTDAKGIFQFNNLPPGEYKILISAAGYYASEAPVVTVEPGNMARVVVHLEKVGFLFDEVIVTTEGFPATVGRQSMKALEIKRIPGTAGDALRALPVLPSITVANDFNGALYIRGGAPEDNVFYFDRSPIGYPYHFGGLVSTLSSEIIERIDVYAGGFGAEYGTDAQAIIDIYSRRGNEQQLGGKLNLNLLYSEGLLEGPIRAKGSWYLGGRRSHVELLPIEVEQITAFPRFWDYQFKAAYNLSEKHEVTANAFAADDFMKLKLGLKDVSGDPTLAGRFLFENGFDGQGIHLRSLFTDRLTSYLSLTRSFNHFNLNFGQGLFLKIGVSNYQVRQDLTFRFTSGHRLESGLLLATAPTTGAAFFPRRPDEGDPDFDFTFEEKIRSEIGVRYNRIETYLQHRYRPAPFLSIAAGFRIDYLNLTDEVSLGPRASLKFRIPSGSEVRFAYGRYEQSPQPPLNFPDFGNPDVKSSEASHYILELERQLTGRTEFKVAGYYRDLSNLVTSDREEIYLNQGDGRARGLELFLRHNAGTRFFGWVSYAYVRSERRDRPGDPWRLYSFDQTHVTTLTGSYMLSRTWEVGAKWQYSTGNPYTPVIDATIERHPTTGLPTYRPIYGDINSERVPPFHRLDIRVNKSFTFNNWEMGIYVELLNAYNRKNVLTVDYNYDYTEQDVVNQLPLIPYFGVTAEF
ncbi:MAG: TonB-dependent receptor [Candidatus Poribacteria bacterium]|nr:TonB-dependent receptor [Candidatus Poribacteria bacterium]